MSDDRRFEGTWQGRELAEHYERWAAHLLPRREELLETLCFLLELDRQPAPRVLDLGAGTGDLAARLGRQAPEARITCLDLSTQMWEFGCQKVAGLGPRVQFVQADLSDPAWAGQVEPPFDAVVSAVTFHYLSDKRKRELCVEVHGLLRPGGRFLNADRVRAPAAAIERLYLDYWYQHVARQASALTDQPVTAETVGQRQQRFDQAANVRPASLEENLAWLRAAGFDPVDCFWKNMHWAVFGGFRA